MKKKNLNIALKLEGPASEKGLIRLDDFLGELSALRETLETIDREINGKSTLYYRVVNLSHRKQSNSKHPSKVVIEPVLKARLKTPGSGARYVHLPEQVHHMFFKTLGLIRKDRTNDLQVGEPVIDAIAGLLAGLGTEFVGGEIGNHESKFKLDNKLKDRVEGLLKPEYRSSGSVEGQLLTLNVARGNRFYIYPTIGARSISCKFPESMFEKAHSCIRKNVRVYGTKLFRAGTGFPFKVADVEKIELLEPERPFPEFTPSPIKVVGESADELIRESREEWGD